MANVGDPSSLQAKLDIIYHTNACTIDSKEEMEKQRRGEKRDRERGRKRKSDKGEQNQATTLLDTHQQRRATNVNVNAIYAPHMSLCTCLCVCVRVCISVCVCV